MELHGRVQNGVVVIEGHSILPEGTPVVVSDRTTPATPVIRVSKHPKRVEFPLVPSLEPGSLHLTGEMIAEILDADDMAS